MTLTCEDVGGDAEAIMQLGIVQFGLQIVISENCRSRPFDEEEFLVRILRPIRP